MKRYTWKAPEQFDILAQKIRATTAPESLEMLFDGVLKNQPLLNYNFGRGRIFWRGRFAKGKDGWAHQRDLGPPVPDKAAAGRLNDAGAPIFYGATRVHTVLTELNAQEGDYVHLSGIKILPKVAFRFVAIGDLFHVFKTGHSQILGGNPAIPLNQLLNSWEPETGRRIIFFDALLASFLMDARARDNGYLHTRAIAHAVFRKNELIEGFFYPSVCQESGMNLAIKPDTYYQKTHIVSSRVIRILKRRDLGIFDYEVCRRAKRINEDTGFFEWADDEDLAYCMILFGMTRREEQFSEARNHRLTGNDYLEIAKLPRSST